MKSLLKHIFLLGLCLILPCAPSYGENNKAILIGISQYADPDINCLAYADEDILTFSSILANFSGYQPSEINTLLNQEATKQNILKIIDDTVRQSQKKPIDHFIFMFAGHGLPPHIQSNNTNSFLAPHDARLDEFHKESKGSSLVNNETFINKAWFARQISSLKAKSIVLIMDSCYSGARNFSERFAENLGFSVGFEAEGTNQRGIMIVQKSDIYGSVERRIAYLASSNENQPSVEYHELKHGALSYCIFEYVNAVRKETDETERQDITVNSMYNNITKLFHTVEVKGVALSTFHLPVLLPIPDYAHVQGMTFISIQGNKKPKVKTGILELITNPENAEVSVDGVRIGPSSNRSLELTEGRHMISLYLPETNYNYSFVVNIKEGQIKREVINLRGSLAVESYSVKRSQTAPQLDVYVDDQYVGKTGLALSDLVAGTHTLEIRVEKVTKKRQIEIRPTSPLLVKYKIVRDSTPPPKKDLNVDAVVF